MTTNKELADAYRLVAEDYFDNIGLLARADELDPPKPTYPEGTIAWVTSSDGDSRLCMRRKSSWASCVDTDGLTCVGMYEDEVTNVEPLRVLGDDEIALPKFNLDTAALRDLVRDHDHSGDSLPRMSISARRVVWHYADALDAEAGDAK